jgi:hypothetical protein
MALSIGAAGAPPAEAYLKFGIRQNNQNFIVRWNRLPVRYFVGSGGVPGVSAADFRTAVGRAFATWEAVPTAGVSFEFVGFTSAAPLDEDGQSTLGFLSEPGMDRVLAATSFLISSTNAEILESDIFFNSAFDWSVAPSGSPGRFDIESIALHEIGHMIGLGHSAIGETEPRPGGGRRVIGAESVMFPIAFLPGSIDDRTLRNDDIAGISDVYPAGSFREETGSVNGRVRQNGRGVNGAHLTLLHLETGKLVGGFSVDDDGNFSISGLGPGPHILRVEPIDDADIESFFDDVSAVDVDFPVTFYDRVIVAPKGGAADPFDVDVGRR